jgi:membrane associated rhomboid family serine protease
VETIALTGEGYRAMFIAIPVGMNYRTDRYPVVTLSLIGLNTLIWLVSTVFFFSTNGDSEYWILDHLWLIPAVSYPWMYLTSMFVHAGFLHLFGNMIFLFLFGSCVEDMIGRLRFTIFYLIGGLAAELCFIAMTPDHFASEMPMGGASGAISACMGMYLMLRASAEIEFKYFLWFLIVRAGEFEVPAWVPILFWFAKDLLWALIGMTSKHHGGGVAFGAHVGGFLAGLGLLALHKWVWKPREDVVEVEVSTAPIINTAQLVAAARAQSVTVSSETPTIYLHDGAQQTGPFTLTQIQAMLQRGEVSTEWQYWCEGMENWQSVVDLSATPI